MIQTFLLLIPVFTALYGILIHLLFAPKSRTFLTAVMFLFVMTLYLFTGSTYSSPMASMRTQVQMFLLTQLVAPSLIPLFMVYASKLRGKHEHTWAGLMFWVLVPAALFTSAVVQHHMIGSILIFIAMLGFLMEFKAFPHNPKNPEWWDAFHAKHIRHIRLLGRMSLLLGLTFLLYAYHQP